MRILHIVCYYQPELGYEEYYTVKTQRLQNHDVTVITTDRLFPRLPNRYLTPGHSVADGVKLIRLKIKLEVFFDFALTAPYMKLIKRLEPDVVHVHEARSGIAALGVLYAKSLGYPVVLDQHGFEDVYGSPRTVIGKLAQLEYTLHRKHWVNLAYKHADKIIAVTSASKTYVQHHKYGAPADIVVLPLGVDTELFKYEPEVRARTREELGLQDDDILLVCTGRYEATKAVSTLLRAVSSCRAQIPQLKLLLIGMLPDDTKLRRNLLTRAHGTTDDTAIILKNFMPREALPRYFASADIGIWLRQSISIIEAMACRLPVIIPNLPAVTHLLTYKGLNTGLAFELNNIESIVNAIKRLCERVELRSSYGKSAEQKCRNELSYEIRTKKLIDIYRSIMG